MAKKKFKQDAETAGKVALVYIGKTLPGLPSQTIFRDGVVPAFVQKMAEEKPVILRLIVPVNKLAEANKNIKTNGHILNHYAKQL